MTESNTTPVAATAKTVEERLQSIESKFKIAIAVAAIFGVTGAFGASELISAQRELTRLKDGISTVQSARDNAIADIKTASSRQLDANKTEMDTYLKVQANTTMRQQLAPIKDHLRFIYTHAVESAQSGNGANGWWQKALEGRSTLVQEQLR